MIAHPKINENERKILEVLAESYDSSGWDETGYYSFAPLEKKTGLDRKAVRRACRSLARKELAKYLRGLVDQDGMMAGAGYGATRLGASIITPCDVCGDLASFDYYLDDKGEIVFASAPGARRILECDAHHKQSPKAALQSLPI